MTLTMDGYFPRLVDREISELMSSMGAVCIEGPKWCGKTWTALNHANSTFDLSDPFNDFQNRRLAEIDVSGILEGDPPRHIDEWQDVPKVWDAVRSSVDRSQGRGRYILTGSSTPVRKGVYHSGTGRIATVRMRTMSLYESRESSGAASIAGMFDGTMKNRITEDTSLKDLIALVVRGGWPETVANPVGNPERVCRSYIDSIRDEDIERIDGIRRDGAKLRALIRSLGRNESTTVSNKKLAEDIREHDDESVDPETISEYLGVLERMFLIEDQYAFNPGLRSSYRVGKNPKRHLADPSLSAAAIGANRENLYRDLNTFGFLFEGMCQRDLSVYAGHLGGRLGHYRDGRGNEIDAVLELPDGAWGAFEIKLGMNQVDEASERLLRLAERLRDDGRPPEFMCVVVGVASAAYRREDGVYVAPVTALGP